MPRASIRIGAIMLSAAMKTVMAWLLDMMDINITNKDMDTAPRIVTSHFAAMNPPIEILKPGLPSPISLGPGLTYLRFLGPIFIDPRFLNL